MKMAHVTIQVVDLEKSMAFYTDIVDLKVQGDLRPMGAPIVFLGDEEDSTKVELIQRPDEAFKGCGISIGFHVDDVEAKHAELTEKGLNPTPLITPNPHTKFFFVEDPQGVQVQFI